MDVSVKKKLNGKNYCERKKVPIQQSNQSVEEHHLAATSTCAYIALKRLELLGSPIIRYLRVRGLTPTRQFFQPKNTVLLTYPRS